MGSGPRWLLLVAIVVLGIGEFGWIGYQGIVRARMNLHAQLAEHPNNQRPLPDTPSHAFTRNEANAFLDQARRAEAIADPLQRCLAYPDPPDCLCRCRALLDIASQFPDDEKILSVLGEAPFRTPVPQAAAVDGRPFTAASKARRS